MNREDERFERAFEAARSMTEATSEGDATRARILATHARGAARARTTHWLAAAAALLVVLGGSTAWAYWTGNLGAGWMHEDEPAVDAETVTATETVTEPVAATETVTEPAIQTLTVPATETVAATEPVTEPATVTDVADPTERLRYREAHTRHFQGSDATAALQGWNDYLRDYPRGHFALEARYNRALTLVRLGREGEARQALAPFAEGTARGYRQAEARALLEAMSEAPQP